MMLLTVQEARRNLPSPAERKRIREDAKVSLREIGESLGVTASMVHRWETGQHEPRSDHAVGYMKILGDLASVNRECDIATARADGQTLQQIADRYDISQSRVQQIVSQYRLHSLRYAERVSFQQRRSFSTPMSAWVSLGPVVKWMLYDGGTEAFSDFADIAEDLSWLDEWVREAASI